MYISQKARLRIRLSDTKHVLALTLFDDNLYEHRSSKSERDFSFTDNASEIRT